MPVDGSDVLELAGVALLACALGLAVTAWAGLALAGVACFVLSWRATR